MVRKIETPLFIALMLVLTVFLGLIGADQNAKWGMLGGSMSVTEVSADKKGCIFAAWDKSSGAVERVTGCDQYDYFNNEQHADAVMAASEQPDIDW